MSTKQKKNSAPIVLYDGDCRTCSVAKHIAEGAKKPTAFQFVSIHTPKGRELLATHKLDPKRSAYVIEDGVVTAEKSAMVRFVLQRMGILGSIITTISTVIPTHLQDALYDIVARHRM